MADLVSYGNNADRDIQQALIALKKGAHLFKYGRKGKPKFCPFRLSHDESSLIWISSSGEKSLKLASVSRIIPGQRTAVFRRYLRPEKDYLSFSLIYNNGKRSLDLICKDKVEAEVWIASLKALISSLQGGRSKIDGWNDGGLYLDDDKDLASNSASDSSVSAPQDFSSPDVSVSSNPTTSPKSYPPVGPTNFGRSYAPLDRTNMQLKGSNSDAFRVSVSSAPSTSSHGSGPDDTDSLGDVYIWGEIISDNVVKLGPDRNMNVSTTRTDVLLPRPLESNLVLDVSFIACGVRHAALVTKQGELFTWGEESGGRLGHGVKKDVTQPCLVESLSVSDITLVACGEFHTCAVTSSGEMYTCGDGTHNVGLLGHGTEVSHWIPKRISGPLEGLQVASVTCGPWHTALITSAGQLFTFGDGTFGVLGHGDRANVSYPKEVESLSGLRTISVACGVWHTAAVVDVIVTQSSSNTSSGKLFTWGDGDKNRLGHGDKEPRLQPTCVPALIDYNFHKVACGHSLTVALTTSGEVYTMGSTVYGQLGNPECEGKKGDAFLGRSTQGQSLMQLKDVVLMGDFRQMIPKPVNIHSSVSSRSVSPFSRKSSPPRSATPVPTTSGLSFSKGVADSFKKTNENLSQEVIKLRKQVDSLRNQCDVKELELQKSRQKAQEAMVLAAEESAKCNAAKDVIRTLMAQLKDMAERLPPGSYDFESMMSANSLEQNGVIQSSDVNGYTGSISNGSLGPTKTLTGAKETEETVRDPYPNGVRIQSGTRNHVENNDPAPPENEDNNDNYNPSSPASSVTTATTTHHVDAEWIEQYEPGVYITLTALGDGTRDLKRVRFSRRRFGEHQAEIWWSENREQVYERYNVRGSNKSSVSSNAAARRSGESAAPPAKY
ncbi:putative regulator of chromosome condensation 1/beta-lactamase-inhibitor protein II [Helianthus annuus]|nr:putative regulator of chromosome condensation 1/beta-lactamase-inhibitor protein II [Helianthus annuus]KAJ0777168.1 putative regulator of chromosome condensation 1/beta-lactamase-inhibitor protein II [Helianthus annuus]